VPTIHDPEKAETPLARLLLRIVPPNEAGNRTITHLAELVGVSRNAACKWLASQRIPAPRVKRLIEISEGRAKVQDFEAFVYNY